MPVSVELCPEAKMTRFSSLTALPIAAFLSVAACSSAPADRSDEDAWRTDARLGERVDRICFRSTIDNFREASRNSVIVERGVNDEYLIETIGSCYDLDNAMSISFDERVGSSCITRGDNIYAFDSAFGPDRTDLPPVRCPIAGIYKWDEGAAGESEDK
jgi:hypothetical protein